jgi:hypothetical protein
MPTWGCRRWRRIERQHRRRIAVVFDRRHCGIQALVASKRPFQRAARDSSQSMRSRPMAPRGERHLRALPVMGSTPLPQRAPRSPDICACQSSPRIPSPAAVALRAKRHAVQRLSFDAGPDSPWVVVGQAKAAVACPGASAFPPEQRGLAAAAAGRDAFNSIGQLQTSERRTPHRNNTAVSAQLVGVMRQN